jgi:hypothetical protein
MARTRDEGLDGLGDDLEYLKTQAAQGRRSDFTDYLSRVPDAPATAGDEIS